MKYANFLIKPASSLCNMRCRYCFYEDEASNRTLPNMGLMDEATMEELIRQAFSVTDRGGEVTFTFQGGEPTMAGLPFFRSFTETAARLNTRRIPVHYSLQTNGLALNEDWAALFKEYGFLVGVSLDGDKPLHDSLRPDAAGKGTWTRVTRNLSLLLRAGVDVNLLCVVTRNAAKSAVRIYHALQKTGVRYLQFIACLDPLEGERGSMPYSLRPQEYGTFLCDLFDAWYLDWKGGRYTSIRLFDDYVHLAMGLPAGTCATSGSCGAYCVVEADGSLYPCDFYVLDEWKTGKLGEEPLSGILNHETAVRFLQEGLVHPAACASCPWEGICCGGCKRDWWTDPDTGEKANYFCPAFQKFFAYAMPRIREMAQAETDYAQMARVASRSHTFSSSDR